MELSGTCMLRTTPRPASYPFEELLHRFYRSRSKLLILLSSLYVSACPEIQQRLLGFPSYNIESSTNPSPCPTYDLTSLNP